LLFYSPPCQAFSIAGKQDGFEDHRGTLFFDALKIIQAKKPKYAIMENVKGLTQKKFQFEFETMLQLLEQEGYKNYWRVLNAKDYGIPQNRERVFIVSIREDVKQEFEFPKSFDNGIRLKDMLEDYVDEKYYLSKEKSDKLIEEIIQREMEIVDGLCINTKMQNNQFNNKGCFSIISTCYKEPLNVLRTNEIIQIGMLDIKGNEQIRRVYDPEGIAPTLNTMQGGNRQPKVIVENKLIFVGGIGTSTDKWIEDGKTFSRNFKEGYRIYDSEGIACAQKSNGGGLGGCTGLYKIVHRIRKLTPLECMRLMGFEDEDYIKLKNNKISNSQIYKMAGNSLVVDTVENILKNLLVPTAIYSVLI
jgi:DNA (cytosine-5)-methyltransferase 1